MGFFDRLKQGLTKTRDNIVSGIDAVFHGFSEIDDDCAQKLRTVISWLNQNLCMGCFVLSNEGDYLYYNYSFEITEDMDAPIIMDILGQTLGIIGETIREGIEILTPLMNGEKSIDEMLNSNIAILQ